MALKNENFSMNDSAEILSQIKVKRCRIRQMSSSEDFSTDTSSEEDECSINSNSNNTAISHTDWSDPIGNQPRLTPFIGTAGFKLYGNYEKVEEIYLLLVNDEIFQIIVEETNRYAEQMLLKKTLRLDDWLATDKNEIKRFFGLIMWMGIVKLPEVHLYWSDDPAYAQSLPRSVMPLNRFELLLRTLHFSNNENENVNDRLYKIRPIMDILSENVQKFYDPGEVLCVDEFPNPFQGRIIFKQYLKQKRHRYGIKVYKLCTAPGYTSNFQIYFGRKTDVDKMTPTNVVMSLCKNIFGKGRTVCTNNRYTSIELAKKLIAENTHLIGTMRSNCPGIPKNVATKKLKRNEQIAKENKDGITLLKWKDKRNVLLLSTKHSDETVVLEKKGKTCIQPRIIVDYNQGMSHVDDSDQMTLYCNPLCKTVKWYRKIAFELCLNTAVVNAWIIYNSITHNKITHLEFRKRLAKYLIACNEDCDSDYAPTVPKRRHHQIKKKEGKSDSVRKRCKNCYQNNVKKFGSQLARNNTIRVSTFCDDCPDKPPLCLPCFNEVHRNIPL